MIISIGKNAQDVGLKGFWLRIFQEGCKIMKKNLKKKYF